MGRFFKSRKSMPGLAKSAAISASSSASLDIGDLLQQQFDAGEFAQQRRLQSTRQRSPVACHQPVKPGSPIFVQWIITGDSLASEQPFDAIDVLNSFSQQVGTFT